MSRPPSRGKRWSKLKARVESLWAEGCPMAIHCNVFPTTTKHDFWTEPHHWIVLDGRVIWDFPGPFLKPDATPGRDIIPKPEPQGARLSDWESGYGGEGLRPSTPSFLMHSWIDRPRERLMEPVEEDRWELTDILRTEDRRLGRDVLARWGGTLDAGRPANVVLGWRLG